jgi:hypothetical protein
MMMNVQVAGRDALGKKNGLFFTTSLKYFSVQQQKKEESKRLGRGGEENKNECYVY